MRDISRWFEEKSSEQDSAGIRKHLDTLIARLPSTASTTRQSIGYEYLGTHRRHTERDDMKGRLTRMLLLAVAGESLNQNSERRYGHA